jgi:hypothetical protein
VSTPGTTSGQRGGNPLDLAWAALTTNEQRMHAAAEARAFYRRPCREYHGGERDRARNAARDELIEALGDADDD